MDSTLDTVITIVVSVIASGGFWSYLQRRENLKGATTQLLLGLAHDRIIFLGMAYIERGFVTKDEYEDFRKYLYDPYSQFGGNGLAEKVAAQVSNLPMVARLKTEIKVTEV